MHYIPHNVKNVPRQCMGNVNMKLVKNNQTKKV